MNQAATTWTMGGLRPFGMLITAPQTAADIGTQSAPMLRLWLAGRRFVVLRGFTPLVGRDLLDFCGELGEPVEGDFGTTQANADQSSAVPFHFDGLFGEPAPRYLFFVCQVAPPVGGQSVFCDTTRVLKKLSDEQRSLAAAVRVTCTSETPPRTATFPLVGSHPEGGEPILRFAEPAPTGNVAVELEGLPEAARAGFLRELQAGLVDPAAIHEHTWQAGDMILADNMALLHGRRASADGRLRHVKRVNIV